jgi:hypothetical protein
VVTRKKSPRGVPNDGEPASLWSGAHLMTGSAP